MPLYNNLFFEVSKEKRPMNNDHLSTAVTGLAWKLSYFLTKKIEMKFLLLLTEWPVYNDHPRNRKIVVVVDRWLVFRGHVNVKIENRTPKK